MSNHAKVSKPTYAPSIPLLRALLRKKRQLRNVVQYKFLIVLRHHETQERVVDHLICTLIAHFERSVFIVVSMTDDLYSRIDKRIFQLCDYIKPDVYNGNTPNDIWVALHGFLTYREVPARYCIHHSGSEYYCQVMDPNFEIHYTPKPNPHSPSPEEIRSALKSYSTGSIHDVPWSIKVPGAKPIPTWWHIAEEAIDFFCRNRILPLNRSMEGALQGSGIVMRKDIMDGLLDALKGYKKIKTDAAPDIELIPYAYVSKFYTFDKWVITKWFLHLYSTGQRDILAQHIRDKEGGPSTFWYNSIKRVDDLLHPTHGKDLLHYLHEHFVSPWLERHRLLV